jgi:hypothetical protein
VYLAACRQPAHRFCASLQSGERRSSDSSRHAKQHLAGTYVDGAADSDKDTAKTETGKCRQSAAAPTRPNSATFSHSHELPNGDGPTDSHADEYGGTLSYWHGNG